MNTRVEPGFADKPLPALPADRSVLDDASPKSTTFPNHDGKEL